LIDYVPVLEAGQRQKRKSMAFLVKEAFTREATTGRKHNTCTCKEGQHKESDNWKEEQHARMGGIPNDGRFKVLLRYCKWLKSLKCINIDV
jgi:hypothetical protein